MHKRWETALSAWPRAPVQQKKLIRQEVSIVSQIPESHNHRKTVGDAALIFKMLWQDVGFHKTGVSILTGCSTFLSSYKNNVALVSCSKIFPLKCPLPETPGRPDASSHCCWSVNNKTQKRHVLTGPPSPSAQIINSKDRGDSGHLFEPLKPKHSYSNFYGRIIKCSIKCTWPCAKRFCPPTKQFKWQQQKGSNDFECQGVRGPMNS